MLAHAIEGPWAENTRQTLRFPDRDPKAFKELVHYIHHGFIRRSVSFPQLQQLFEEAEFFQFTRLVPLPLRDARSDALRAEDVKFMLECHPRPLDLSQAVFAHQSYQGQSFASTNFNGTCFFGCELKDCDFSECCLGQVVFHSCWCEGICFRNSNTEQGGMQFTSCRLSKADLSGLDLRGSTFQDVDLNGAILCAVNLTGANMQNFDLRDVNFAGADLTGADLRGCKLDNAIFNSACLANARFDGATGLTADFACANMTGTSFQGANFCGANFASWIPSFVSSGSDGSLSIVLNFKPEIKVKGACFHSCRLEQSIFSLDITAAREYWELHAIRYISPTLPRFDLLASSHRVKRSLLDAKGARHSLDNLQLRNFEIDLKSDAALSKYSNKSMTGLHGIDLSRAVLCKARLQNVDLQGANLSGADLRCALISGANLSKCDMTGAKLQAQLLGTVALANANLEAANLTNAVLVNCNIEGTRFNSATTAVRAQMSDAQRQILLEQGAETQVPSSQEGRFVQTPTIPANAAGSHGMLNTPDVDNSPPLNSKSHARSHSLVGNTWTPDSEFAI